MSSPNDSNSDHAESKRQCSKCHRIKPLDAFQKASRYKDGYRRQCKECRRHASRRWREDNRKHIQQYRKDIQEKRNARLRQKLASNPEYREKMREQGRIKYRKSREKRLIKIREYYKTPRGRAAYRAARHRREARKHKAVGTHTAADIRTQYDRQRGRCYYCCEKVGKKYHVDHVIPLSRGGSNGPENIVIACADCNQHKHNKLPHEWSGSSRLL